MQEQDDEATKVSATTTITSDSENIANLIGIGVGCWVAVIIFIIIVYWRFYKMDQEVIDQRQNSRSLIDPAAEPIEPQVPTQ